MLEKRLEEFANNTQNTNANNTQLVKKVFAVFTEQQQNGSVPKIYVDYLKGT